MCVLGEGTLPTNLLPRLHHLVRHLPNIWKGMNFAIRSAPRDLRRDLFLCHLSLAQLPPSCLIELSCAREWIGSFFFSLWLHLYTLCNDPIQCKCIQFPKQQLLFMQCTPLFLCCVHEKENAGWCHYFCLIPNWLVVAAAERAMSYGWCSARRETGGPCLPRCARAHRDDRHLCVMAFVGCHSDTWSLLYCRNTRAGSTQNLCSSGQAEETQRLCPPVIWSESPSSREIRLDSTHLLCCDCSQGHTSQLEDPHGVGWWREWVWDKGCISGARLKTIMGTAGEVRGPRGKRRWTSLHWCWSGVLMGLREGPWVSSVPVQLPSCGMVTKHQSLGSRGHQKTSYNHLSSSYSSK